MQIDRRELLKVALATASISPMTSFSVRAGAATPAVRRVVSTGEDMPIVGLGSWITFNVGRDPKLRDESAAVIAAFLEGGGRMIDSSPMYGSSQATIGYGLRKLGYPKNLFSAEKVWTSSQSDGPRQIAKTKAYWGVPRFDLLQVHNLLNWRGHLETLAEMKADGRLRTIGITTSHGGRHKLLEKIMASEPIDFVQVTYNILDREVEQRILPLAQEKGIGVIVNRPYRRGALIEQFRSRPLPVWVAETGALSWAQFLLKFVISHSAVTCAIPATTRVDHVRENLAAASGVLPDANLRQRMANYVKQF
ncbi:MAG: aldo/keto reductase [Hyphomicrobiaceae bacterium]